MVWQLVVPGAHSVTETKAVLSEIKAFGPVFRAAGPASTVIVATLAAAAGGGVTGGVIGLVTVALLPPPPPPPPQAESRTQTARAQSVLTIATPLFQVSGGKTRRRHLRQIGDTPEGAGMAAALNNEVRTADRQWPAGAP